MSKRRVGVIGLGKMGLPIAANLMERGFTVTGYRRSGTDELVAIGGAGADSPAEVAARSDVLLSILPDAEAVAEIVAGENGTLAGLTPGTVHIEMSTVDVSRKSAVRDQVVAAGGELLDAPISGGPMLVPIRRATTFASGDQDAVDSVSDVLDAVSGPWVYTGAFGTGASMKYVATMLMAIHTVAAAEAVVLARSTGLDLDLVQRTLDESIASSAIWRQRGPLMQSRSWLPAPGPIATLHEILDQVGEVTDGLGLDLALFTATRTAFDKAMADGWDGLDIAAIHDQVAGLPALQGGAG